jgi:hypothetical protein
LNSILGEENRFNVSSYIIRLSRSSDFKAFLKPNYNSAVIQTVWISCY